MDKINEYKRMKLELENDLKYFDSYGHIDSHH